MMNIFLLSVTHRTAPLAIREHLALDDDQCEMLLDDLGKVTREAVTIITCNRTELYAVAKDGESADLALAALAEHAGIADAELSHHVIREDGVDAVRHLFKVAAGLDSLILGEPQILGQVRAAAEAATATNRSGVVLTKLFNYAVATGKRARTETSISEGAGSISHAAVELARSTLGDLSGRQGVVIGVGEMGKLVARNLVAHGVKDLCICNRSEGHAHEMAVEMGGRVIPWQELDGALSTADIAITATGARQPILTRELLQPVMEQRAGRPLLLIDIAVPRDIDPLAGTLPFVHLHDIDALEEISAANRHARQQTVPQVEEIIDQQVETFTAWYRGHEVGPVIRDMRAQVNEIRQREVDKALRRLGHLNDRDQEVVRALSHAIANNILHTPLTRLKRSDEQEEHVRAMVELFDLPEG